MVILDFGCSYLRRGNINEKKYTNVFFYETPLTLKFLFFAKSLLFFYVGRYSSVVDLMVFFIRGFQWFFIHFFFL